MALTKGHRNNPNGRPKGSKNNRTKQWEALGEAIIGRHAERLNRVLDSLPDDEFVKSYGLIVNYFKPKLSSAQVDAKVDTQIHLIHPDDDLFDKI